MVGVVEGDRPPGLPALWCLWKPTHDPRNCWPTPSRRLPRWAEILAGSVREVADCDREIEAFAREPGGGLVALSNTIFANNLERVHTLAARYRLPAVHSYPIYAQTGGLLSYGPDNLLFHDVARYIDQILRGAKPGDLPVQQPTRFLLVVNLKTAKDTRPDRSAIDPGPRR